MLDINVTGLTLRDVSITYTTTVGNDDAYNRDEKITTLPQIGKSYHTPPSVLNI